MEELLTKAIKGDMTIFDLNINMFACSISEFLMVHKLKDSHHCVLYDLQGKPINSLKRRLPLILCLAKDTDELLDALSGWKKDNIAFSAKVALDMSSYKILGIIDP